MNDLKPSEIIRWFEAKAAEFRQIAAALKATFNAEGQPSLNVSPSPAAPQGNGTPDVTLDTVLSAARQLPKAARYSTIAEKIGPGATAHDVRSVIEENPDNFEQVGRGWWKPKSYQ